MVIFYAGTHICWRTAEGASYREAMTENVAGNAHADDVPEADALEQSAAADSLADDDIINALPDEPLGGPDGPVPPASEWDEVEQKIVVVPPDEDYS